ncbi:helix-turn-helix domain-containing protein [Streptomyces sp. NPDC091268]|uniref:helix-turn-helix domain-containing protein n=1 Tax=Streptomyces sp. NPDC091268 TaxID=3365979 RepID=UPI0038126062
MASHAHHGTTSSALTRLNVDTARRLGIPAHEYAHLPGLAPEHLHDDLCRPPAATSIRITELATARTPWTEVSRAMAQQAALGSLGVWDYLITSAATALEGIRDAAAHLGAVLDSSTDTLRVVESGEHVTISHVNHADLGHEAACAVRACALGLYQRRLTGAAQRRLVPVHVALAATAPRRHDALIELYGTRSLEFEAPVSSLTFLASDLTGPNPRSQPGLSGVLRRHAEQTLAAAVPLHDWLDLFRTVLTSAHAEATPTLSAVARRMAVSTRTLQRRLDEHGTTWNGELDAVRRAQVTQLLVGTDLSLDAIAARSGYADARALRRAVQRWHGATPGALRRAGRPGAAGSADDARTGSGDAAPHHQ